MTPNYNWNPEYADATITILSVSIGFAIYWFLSLSEKIKTLFLKNSQPKMHGLPMCFFKNDGCIVFGNNSRNNFTFKFKLYLD